MGAVTSFDPVAEHERTRAAFGAVLPRLARLLRETPDMDAPSGVPAWTVGDVGAHLAGAYFTYAAGFTDEPMDWDGIVPRGDGPLGERIAAVNALSVGLLGREERARLHEVVAERGETFLRLTEGLAPDTPVAAPWLGRERTIPLSAATGLMLSEGLVHGLDMARGARRPWPIGADEAGLVIGQSMPTMMPLALDTVKARGARIAFDLVLKGGPRLAVVVDGGTATVTRDAPPRAYDCRITAAPVTFLLVSFRRTPIWKAMARGGLWAGGRRPWLATRLGELIATP